MIDVTAPPHFRAGLGRALDIGFALLGMIVFAPLMLMIAAAIMIESGRPVLFMQSRLGRGGQLFSMYKFRKFGPRRADDGCPLTLRDDARMTRVGRILAQTKLDELPQLVNILRGEMAVVGPRPESMAFADCFGGPARAVLAHRPGIFGPSQVAFRSEAELYPAGVEPTQFYRETLFPAKAALDLGYYPRRTVLADLGWIARGVAAVAGGAPSGNPIEGRARAPSRAAQLSGAASATADAAK